MEFTNPFIDAHSVQIKGDIITNGIPIDITSNPYVSLIPDGNHSYIYIVDGVEKTCENKLISYDSDKAMNCVIINDGDYSPAYLLTACQIGDNDAINNIIYKIKQLNIKHINYKHLNKLFRNELPIIGINGSLGTKIIYILAECYRIKNNYAEAIKYYEVSAERGCKSAMFELGKFHQFISKNYDKMHIYYNNVIDDIDINNIHTEDTYYADYSIMHTIYYYGKYHQYVSKNYDEMKKYYDICVKYYDYNYTEDVSEMALIHYGLYYRDIENDYDAMFDLWQKYIAYDNPENRQLIFYNAIQYLIAKYYSNIEHDYESAIKHLENTFEYIRGDNSLFELAYLKYNSVNDQFLSTMCAAISLQLNKNAIKFMCDYYSDNIIKLQPFIDVLNILEDTNIISARNKFDSIIKSYDMTIDDADDYNYDSLYYFNNCIPRMFNTLNEYITLLENDEPIDIYYNDSDDLFEYGDEYKYYGLRDNHFHSNIFLYK